MLRKLCLRQKSCLLIKKPCSLNEINFNDQDLLMKTCLKLFSLNINKLHGHDNLFAIMIKICDSVIKDSCHNIKKIVFHQKLSKIFRKNWMLFQYIRKLVNKLLIMTDQFLYFCFRENFWKSSFNSILKCQKKWKYKKYKTI